ncbi:hypothetical protein ACH4U3_12945 [Streptomyces griseoruber]|uniref:hypothetical protein n=1 Tax=Streptomyces griseoruber TaxID=1943 RepID=UPI0037A956C0
MRSRFGVGHVVVDERVVARLGERRPDEPALHRGQVQHLWAARVAGLQQRGSGDGRTDRREQGAGPPVRRCDPSTTCLPSFLLCRFHGEGSGAALFDL